jgi:hypothetical protein
MNVKLCLCCVFIILITSYVLYYEIRKYKKNDIESFVEAKYKSEPIQMGEDVQFDDVKKTFTEYSDIFQTMSDISKEYIKSLNIFKIQSTET